MKPLAWVGSSKSDLLEFPSDVVDDVGFALYLAQIGRKAESAKPLKGFGGAGVLEIVANHDGDTFRAVYTVRFQDFVYVLHAFQKKSRQGSVTPTQELDKVKARLAFAEEDYRKWQSRTR